MKGQLTKMSLESDESLLTNDNEFNELQSTEFFHQIITQLCFPQNVMFDILS